MDKFLDLQKPDCLTNEADADPRIRGLRVLARIIARDLINSRRQDKKNINAMSNEKAKLIDP